jgi:hypothetical protein
VGKTSPQVSREINASEGGEITSADNTLVRIPPNSLPQDAQVSIQTTTADRAPELGTELVSVGNAQLINLGSDQPKESVTLEIPFDPALLPNDVNPDEVFLSYYDEGTKEWVYAGGQVDTSRNVIVLETNHASWWMPTTWNWQAWIAVLNKTLQVSIVNWIEAAKLLTTSCPQTGNYVQVDSSQARNVVQGCIEQDDVDQPGLRIVNPKSFFFEVQPVSGGNGYPKQTLLAPGEDLKFKTSTSDPAPLVIEASMTQKSGWYLVVHMVITMLPGANQFGIQGKQVACITERLADVHYFADAAEALVVNKDGAAAAESLSRFMLDSDAVRRFITAADDCNFGPASTWSVEGISQIGGAVSTIMSATDYIANYLAGNASSRLSFIWSSLKSRDNVIGIRWYDPKDGISYEFFENGEYMYYSFSNSVDGKSGFNKRGTYNFIDDNKIRVDNENFPSPSGYVFNVGTAGEVLTIGEKKLYKLTDDFSPLTIPDKSNYRGIYLGYWENKDPFTRSIPALYVFLDEKEALQVHAWGSCLPDWCDWGTAEAKVTDQFLYVFWDHSFARVHMVVSLSDQGELVVRTLTHFMDNSGRSDYSILNEYHKSTDPIPTPSR